MTRCFDPNLRPLTVLNVAYPLAEVSVDAAGGAEQVLASLDRALVRAGHRSLVLACTGSKVRGELWEVPLPGGRFDERARAAMHAVYRQRLEQILARESVDAIHMHGIDFASYLPREGPPVLVTVHLPPAWYPEHAFRATRPRTYLLAVSADQRAAWPREHEPLAVIENGVDLEAFPCSSARRKHLLALGRICPEKGFHLALEAARRAQMPLILAGALFPYLEHQRYFEHELLPRLDRERRFVGAVGLREKRLLLRDARALLIPSLAPETSSLVAMEAMASGVPVVAFRAGALREIVDHGRTGYLVNDEREMAACLHELERIDPGECRREAERRFSLARMSEAYLSLYRTLSLGARAEHELLRGFVGELAEARAVDGKAP